MTFHKEKVKKVAMSTIGILLAVFAGYLLHVVISAENDDRYRWTYPKIEVETDIGDFNGVWLSWCSGVFLRPEYAYGTITEQLQRHGIPAGWIAWEAGCHGSRIMKLGS